MTFSLRLRLEITPTIPPSFTNSIFIFLTIARTCLSQSILLLLQDPIRDIPFYVFHLYSPQWFMKHENIKEHNNKTQQQRDCLEISSSTVNDRWWVQRIFMLGIFVFQFEMEQLFHFILCVLLFFLFHFFPPSLNVERDTVTYTNSSYLLSMGNFQFGQCGEIVIFIFLIFENNKENELEEQGKNWLCLLSEEPKQVRTRNI